MARRDDGILVSLGSASLLSNDETGTDPDGAGTEHQSRRKGLAIVDTTSSDDLDGLSSHRAGLAFAQSNNRRDQYRCRGIASVSAALATLCADDIDTEIKALLDVLGVTDHVHVKDAVLVQFLDNSLGRNTDGGNEELRAALNDHIDQFVQLALCVIVARSPSA